MDVDRSNFGSALKLVTSAVEDGDFIAMDMEMSGLSGGKEFDPRGTDTVQERWAKTKHTADNIAVLQVGLCVFKWTESENDQGPNLQATPFNFYIYPRTGDNGRSWDSRLMFQTSSIEFLASCGFDFNRALRNGVSYCTKEKAEKLFNELEEKEKAAGEKQANDGGDGINLSTLRDFAQGFLKDALEAATTLTNKAQTDDAKAPFVVLRPGNGFVRRLVYQEIPKTFPNIHVGKYAEDNERTNNSRASESRLRLTLLTEGVTTEQLEKERLKLAFKKEIEEIEEKVGFQAVMDVISTSQKPIIGHNCLMDVAHMMGKFVSDLPEDVEQFRQAFHAAFPMLIDTKHMFSENNKLRGLVSRNALGQCFEATASSPSFNATNPTVVLSPGFERYASDEEALHHEAGYDAYMTGVIFARAMATLGLSNASFDASSKKFVLKAGFRAHHVEGASTIGLFGSAAKPEERDAERVPDFEAFDGLFNKLFLMRMNVPLDLGAPNKEVDQSKLVRICNFPRATKTFNIQRTLEDVTKSKVWVMWDNDTSAFFNVQSEEQLERLFKAFLSKRAEKDSGNVLAAYKSGRLEFTDFDLVRYDDWKANKMDDSMNFVEFYTLQTANLSKKRSRDDSNEENQACKRSKQCIIQ